MKTILLILFQIPILLFAQKKVVVKPDASGTIYYATTSSTLGMKAGDTISIQGVVMNVTLDNICVKPYVVRWDTTKYVTANDTIYLSASYIVKTSPNPQKLKWTNASTGGQLYLPSSPATGFTFYFVNNTGESIQADKHLVYKLGKNWKTPDSYRVTFYQGKQKVWFDDKKRWRIQQL